MRGTRVGRWKTKKINLIWYDKHMFDSVSNCPQFLYSQMLSLTRMNLPWTITHEIKIDTCSRYFVCMIINFIKPQNEERGICKLSLFVLLHFLKFNYRTMGAQMLLNFTISYLLLTMLGSNICYYMKIVPSYILKAMLPLTMQYFFETDGVGLCTQPEGK